MLASCGQALFGTRWQTDLAVALGIDARLMRRWVEESRPVPNLRWQQILELMIINGANINDAITELSHALESNMKDSP